VIGARRYKFNMPTPRHPGELAGADTADVAPNAWIRNRRRTRAWAGIAALWSVIFAGLLFLPGHAPSHASPGAFAVVGAFYFGIAALGIVFARRVARAGLWIGTTGIVVRGPFRTCTVALDDAEFFGPGLQGRGGNGVPCPLLTRRDGPAVGVWALGRRNIWFRYRQICQEIEPLCGDLNELVAGMRTATPPR
jgi:hypothetical protein